MRNKVSHLIKLSKKLFYNKKLDPTLPPAIFWKNVRSLGIGKSRSVIPIPFSPDELNTYFHSAFSEPSPLNVDSSDIRTDHENMLSFCEINIDDLHFAIQKIKSTAIGLDNINLKFIKIIFPFISQYILDIFNQIIQTSSYPQQWKISKIIPIPKNKSVSLMSDFRPISILPSLSKAFEYIIKEQIHYFLESNNLYQQISVWLSCIT